MSERSADESGHWRVPFLPWVPADAVATVLFVVPATAVVATGAVESVPLRAIAGVPLLFLLPGYALVASLFPGSERGTGNRLGWPEAAPAAGAVGRRGIDWPERVALAFGASVALLPLVAVAVALAGLPYSRPVVAGSLATWTLAWTGVGVVRRRGLAPEQRFAVPSAEWFASADRALSDERSALDAVLTVGLAVLVVISLAGVGYAMAVPNNAESYTSMALLTPTDDGDLVAADYPAALASSDRLVLRVTNREDSSTVYTVVAVVERVDRGGTVTDQTVIGSATNTVGVGEAWSWHHALRAPSGDQRDRLAYYLYRGDAPDGDGAGNATSDGVTNGDATSGNATDATGGARYDAAGAYRHVRVWLGVGGGDER